MSSSITTSVPCKLFFGVIEHFQISFVAIGLAILFQNAIFETRMLQCLRMVGMELVLPIQMMFDSSLSYLSSLPLLFG
jgi:hypothetical protein